MSTNSVPRPELSICKTYLADEGSAGVALAGVLALLAGAQHLGGAEPGRAVRVLAGAVRDEGHLKLNHYQ